MVTTDQSLDFVVQEIEVRQGARVIKRISGAQLQAQRGFAADKWTDSQGRQAFEGMFAMGVTGSMHERAWVEFELDLPAGEYTLLFKLGTCYGENNVNDAMRSQCRFGRLENIAARPRQRHSKSRSTRC